MKKKLYIILTTLLIVMLTSTPAFARGAIKLTSVSFDLGSLIALGEVKGLGNTDVLMVLEGSGPADVLCVNNGENPVPGQSSPRISSIGTQLLDGDQERDKNGRTDFVTIASTDDPLSWDVAGCPNSNWVGVIDFVYWENATIYVYDLSGNLLLQQDYTCVTTRDPDSISCTPVN